VLLLVRSGDTARALLAGARVARRWWPLVEAVLLSTAAHVRPAALRAAAPVVESVPC
jgi:hypothetical protein